MFGKLWHHKLTLLDARCKSCKSQGEKRPRRTPCWEKWPASKGGEKASARANAGGTNFAVKVQTACAIDVYKRKRKFFSILFGALSVGPASAIQRGERARGGRPNVVAHKIAGDYISPRLLREEGPCTACIYLWAKFTARAGLKFSLSLSDTRRGAAALVAWDIGHKTKCRAQPTESAPACTHKTACPASLLCRLPISNNFRSSWPRI